jgi:hypothetical protein
MPIKPYDHTTYPTNGALGSSSALRNELDAIESGFDMVATEIETALTGATGAATTATTKASEALASANNADISEAAAAASAAAALVSQGAAATSETNAAASALAVANTYDAFDDRYLGTKAVAPTLDNDGNALQQGTLYWDSELVTLRGYNGSVWVNLPVTTASNVTNVPAGNLAATTVQAALDELQTDIDTRATSSALTAHIGSGTDAHDASAISYLGSANLAAATVEAALDELDTEKIALAGGTLTGALNEAQGADIASASTVNLTTATGNYVHITGTTTITAITLAQGYERTVVFDGLLTLTNGASLLLPTAANITTATGDTAVFRGESAGVVRCVCYVRKDGTALSSSVPAFATQSDYNTGTDTTKVLNSAILRQNNIVQGTAIATTSSTSHDYTGIPSWVKRITVMFSGVSTNGSSPIQIQLGDSGGIENTGYVSSGAFSGASGGGTTSTSGLLATAATAGTVIVHGVATITYLGSNIWAANAVLGRNDAFVFLAGGSKTLSATLTQIRITTVNGTDTFDAGSINILYE